ncbi:MAG: hypothetical protein V3U57_00260 [Robiginitomaculum sp.]
MIKSFECKRTEKLFNRRGGHRFPSDIQIRAVIKLRVLHASIDLNDLRVPPSNHAHNVEIVDYH